MAPGAPEAQAQSGVLTGGIVGAQLHSRGDTVTIEVRPSTSSFLSELYLQRPGGDILIATNRETGTRRTIGPYPTGEELVFYIRVRNTADTFFTGPGRRNLDEVEHAAVLDRGDGSLLVGFEDQFGGGDRDYDDDVFQFTGSVASGLPPAADDQWVTTDEDVPVDVLLAATDPDGTVASYAVTRPPADGTLTGAGASLTYTPDADFNGADSFDFTVVDDDGLTDTATVTITVRPANDPPIAHDSSIATDEDTPVDITFSSSDVDGGPPTYEVVSGPSHGTLSGTGATRTYTPDADFNGADAVELRVEDGNGGSSSGRVSIDVRPVGDTPVAEDDSAATDENAPVTLGVLANDTDVDEQPLTASLASPPSHGTATCSGSTCTYRPVSNFVGTDTFEYRASDPDGGSDVATVTVTVRGVGVDGRMTGGSHRGSGVSRVQQELDLACKAADGGAMTVRDAGATFVLTAVDYARCTHAAGADTVGKAPFETHEGSGTGTLNGAEGATVEWKLVDGGEGRDAADFVDITVRYTGGAVVLRSSGPISGGNIQARRR